MAEKIIKREVLEDIISHILGDYFVNSEKKLIGVENFKLLNKWVKSKGISFDSIYQDISKDSREKCFNGNKEDFISNRESLKIFDNLEKLLIPNNGNPLFYDAGREVIIKNFSGLKYINRLILGNSLTEIIDNISYLNSQFNKTKDFEIVSRKSLKNDFINTKIKINHLYGVKVSKNIADWNCGIYKAFCEISSDKIEDFKFEFNPDLSTFEINIKHKENKGLKSSFSKFLSNFIFRKEEKLQSIRRVHNYIKEERKNIKYNIASELNICSINDFESKHLNSAYHSKRVSFYSLFLAKQLGLNSKCLRELAIGSSIHDNGKIAVPSEILHKEKSFKPDELKIMRTHAVLGEYTAIFGKKLDFNIARLATEHQERADGSGYPFGVDSSNTSINGLILQFADIFDALLDKRVYKEAWDYNSIRNEFEKLVSKDVLFKPIGEFFLEYTLPVFKEMNFNSSNFNFLKNIYDDKLDTYDDFSQEILGFFKGDKNSKFNGKVSKSLDSIIKTHKPKILYTKEDRFKMIGNYLKNTYDSLEYSESKKALKRIIPDEYLNLGYIKDGIEVI